MWCPRSSLPPNHGRYPQIMQPSQHTNYASHGRRQSISITSYPVAPLPVDTNSLHPYYQPPPQRNISLQARPSIGNTQGTQYPYMSPMHQQQQQYQQQQQQQEGKGRRRQPGMTHSFSAPWDGYGGSQSKPPTPRLQQRSGTRSNGRPSMRDVVRVSAPQDLDGDVFEDDHGACVDVSWGSCSTTAPPFFFSSFLASP